MEKIIKQQAVNGMQLISNYHGIKFIVYKRKRSVESRVYGFESSEVDGNGRVILAIFPNEQLYHASPLGSGYGETVKVRTVDADVSVGDLLQVERPDGRVNRYSVVTRQKLGQTCDVYFELECSGEGV